MSGKLFELVERDEAGNVTATYVQSSVGGQTSSDKTRVDVILPVNVKSPWQRLLDVFMPTGYPHSVTGDYLEYQIYDSLQAFSSSIAGLLSSRAVLSSVGVGDSSASPTAALLLSILQESAGRIATIVFAHRFGTALEPECKMYRLLADVLNDFGFVLDCISPAFPKSARVVILSFSSVLRALCGVAAGSAKASLSAHFARWGNLGELNAKDSSQETVISLMGMLVGSLVVSYITRPVATWSTLMLLLAVHLETNRRAVRAVSMRTLSRQRAGLVYHHLRTGRVPTPEEVAAEERIFEQDGVLRASGGNVLGHCTIGDTIKRFLASTATQHGTTGSSETDGRPLERLLEHFQDRRYVLWYEPLSLTRQVRIHIALKKEANVADQLTAWWHALALSESVHREAVVDEKENDARSVLQRTKLEAVRLIESHAQALRQHGWDLENGALETRSSVRIAVNGKSIDA